MTDTRTTTHLDMTDVDEELEKLERTKAKKKAKTDDGEKSKPELAPLGEVKAPPPKGVKHDFPNPLGLTLTECGLPIELVKDRRAIMQYILLHVQKQELWKLKATSKEIPYYEKYRKMCINRPASSRDFAAALRLIIAGRPMKLPKQEDIVLNGLQ